MIDASTKDVHNSATIGYIERQHTNESLGSTTSKLKRQKTKMRQKDAQDVMDDLKQKENHLMKIVLPRSPQELALLAAEPKDGQEIINAILSMQELIKDYKLEWAMGVKREILQ